MTDKRFFFETFQSIKPGNRTIRGIGKDNAFLTARGIGSMRIKRKVGGKWSLGTIHNVLYVPNLGANLFSIGVATQRRVTATFQDDGVTLSKNEKMLHQESFRREMMSNGLCCIRTNHGNKGFCCCCMKWKHSAVA